MKVEIIKIERVFDGFFKIDEATLRHDKYDGSMGEEIKRLNLDRGDSVAAVVYNKEKNTVIFTRQFRYPVYTKDWHEAWFLEIVAGTVGKDRSSDKEIIREIEEELGYQNIRIEFVTSFYVSPGGTNERIFLYYAEVNDQDRNGKGGGVKDENEDIKLVEMPTMEAFRKIDSGEIIDAKTIIGLQWLRNKLFVDELKKIK